MSDNEGDEPPPAVNQPPGGPPPANQEEEQSDHEDLDEDTGDDNAEQDNAGTEAAAPSLNEIGGLLRQQYEMIQTQWQNLQEKEDHLYERLLAQSQTAAAPSTNSATKPDGFKATPIARLMTYDGSTPWLEYEAHLEEYATAFGWSKEKKAQFLCLSLRGTAQGTLVGLSAEQRRDYKAVTDALRQNFCPAEKIFTYQAELQARRLKKDEDLAELARDIRSKTRLAYPEADPGTREVLMRTHFYNGLTDAQMRLSVSKSHPRTLMEALAYATEYDSIIKAGPAEPKNEKKWSRQTTVKDANDETDFRKQLADLTKKLDDLTRRLSARPRGNRPPNARRRTPIQDVVCYACQKKGHLARDCPSKTSSKTAPTETQPESN